MKNFWTKYKFWIIISLYFLGIVAFARFIVVPLVISIREKAYQVQAKAIDREIEKERIAKLPELRKEWDDYESRENGMNVILGKNDQVSFIENVESMAQLSGNKIDLKIKEDKNDPSFTLGKSTILKEIAYPDYFPIKISLEGDYSGLVKFIHVLENGQLYVNILSISSTKNSPENSGNNTSANPFANSNLSGTPANVSDTQKNDKASIKTDITAIVYIQK